ncbi:unnamed protein product [Caenorhabditis sp. 36 PRJEB53466]|nr:unnamed protein product [Caenorhabditis sp. 36 PRJEB53466]
MGGVLGTLTVTQDLRIYDASKFFCYFWLIFLGSITCSFVLRWATSDSYHLPAFKNKKRLHFVADLSDAGATSFYRVTNRKVKKH